MPAAFCVRLTRVDTPRNQRFGLLAGLTAPAAGRRMNLDTIKEGTEFNSENSVNSVFCPSLLSVPKHRFGVMGKNIKSPPDLSVRQGQMGDGSSPLSLSRTDIRRALAGLPVSRRHSPRQAEFSAS